MAKDKTIKITGALQSVSSQRVPYKPYAYDLMFDSLVGQKQVMVELEVPESMVVKVDADQIILSLDGLNHILQVTADSVDKLHDAYLKRSEG